MAFKTLAAILLCLATLVPARAEDATLTAAEKEKQTLESYAAANKTCREWSDGCAVCTRRADATFACSLPGIACEPVAVTCRQTVDGTQAPKENEPPGTPPK